MFVPIISDRIPIVMAIELTKLILAAEEVVVHTGVIPIICIPKEYVERGKVGLFLYHDDRVEAIKIGCPYKSARKSSVRKVARIMSHEFMHLEQWERGDPITEPAPQHEAVWEIRMMEKILAARDLKYQELS